MEELVGKINTRLTEDQLQVLDQPYVYKEIKKKKQHLIWEKPKVPSPDSFQAGFY